MDHTHDNVSHPRHYTGGLVSAHLECIDITRHLPFSLGNAVKYVWRAGHKGGPDKAIEDLEKALWYIDEHEAHTIGIEYPSLITAEFIARLLHPEDQVSKLSRLKVKVIQNIVKGWTHGARCGISNMMEFIEDDQNQSLPGMR